ncbi:hypothetical protein [Vibrio marisflavi]|nr:hypothetical protein [Vibrio marisflavi]
MATTLMLLVFVSSSVSAKSQYCEGDMSDVPSYVWKAYADHPNNYPVIPAAEPFIQSAFTGRWYIVATSIVSKSVAYQCDCPVIDVGLAKANRYQWEVGMRPDPDLNTIVINPLKGYYQYTTQPNVFKDPVNTNRVFIPNPYYTIKVVKLGPIESGTYAYYVLAIEHMSWDRVPPASTGYTFPNEGTMSFEVYAKNVKEYREKYSAEVDQFVAEQSGKVPAVVNTLKLRHINQPSSCIYPNEPSYISSDSNI